MTALLKNNIVSRNTTLDTGEPMAPVQFDLHGHSHRRREQLEDYIKEKYKQIYQARISEFLPLLLSMNYSRDPQAVVGLKPGSCGHMFLEQYIEMPIEQGIASLARQPVDRHSVVEIGNLVATQRGSSQLLFIILTAVLEEAGYRWMVFTATPQVEKLIRRLDFNPLVLASADPGKLGAQARNWGNYYDTQPRVNVGSIQQAITVLRANPAINNVLHNYQLVIDDLAQRLYHYHRCQCHHHRLH